MVDSNPVLEEVRTGTSWSRRLQPKEFIDSRKVDEAIALRAGGGDLYFFGKKDRMQQLKIGAKGPGSGGGVAGLGPGGDVLELQR